MKTRLFALLAFAASTIPVSAITVVTPSNGAVLTSPFKLVASTSACGGVPAVSMGYSIDHNTATIEPTSFSAMVAATPGAHVLHVKCWGKQVNAQVLLNITIASAPSAATTSSISVASPSNGSTLSSPFTLVASAKTCASVPAVSMGYSIDSGHRNHRANFIQCVCLSKRGSAYIACEVLGAKRRGPGPAQH